jgi:hypothetical protein
LELLDRFLECCHFLHPHTFGILIKGAAGLQRLVFNLLHLCEAVGQKITVSFGFLDDGGFPK